MKRWIDRILIAAVAVLIGGLCISTIPWLMEGHFEGYWLLMHMFASGALVITLPLLALFCLWRNTRSTTSSKTQRLGYWLLIISGLITIATVFLCMLPVASTAQMHELMRLHGYAGFAMVPAVLLFAIGSSRWRRIQATR